jgi:hypothetical protein
MLKPNTQIFLDCDGVLADMDEKILSLFGMANAEEVLGSESFWKNIAQHYRDLWIESGGVFIHHTDVERSLYLLEVQLEDAVTLRGES